MIRKKKHPPEPGFLEKKIQTFYVWSIEILCGFNGTIFLWKVNVRYARRVNIACWFILLSLFSKHIEFLSLNEKVNPKWLKLKKKFNTSLIFDIFRKPITISTRKSDAGDMSVSRLFFSHPHLFVFFLSNILKFKFSLPNLDFDW